MTHISITDEQIKAAQGGDRDAMWEIVGAFDGLIKSVIHRVAPQATHEKREDYLQDGRAALLQLVHDYDSSVSSATLSSFAYRGISRAIAEADVANSTPLSIDETTALRVKRALWEKEGDVEEAWGTFRDAVTPTKRMSRDLFIAAVEALTGADSLDAPVNGSEDDGAALTLADAIPDTSVEVTSDVERRDYARWLMTRIPRRQSFALCAFYGVNMTALPDAEAAAELRVTTSRLRRLRYDGCESARGVAARTIVETGAGSELPQAA